MVRGMMVALCLLGCVPSDEEMQFDNKRRDAWREQHMATPASWAACRAVCGDSAALLPMGDGREWVVCSCVPPGARVEVR